jgi:hypothetical protein
MRRSGYVTVDSENHRRYVPRTTDTMVIDTDTESGKTTADIPGQSARRRTGPSSGDWALSATAVGMEQLSGRLLTLRFDDR